MKRRNRTDAPIVQRHLFFEVAFSPWAGLDDAAPRLVVLGTKKAILV